ncbi:MAG: hypothetical protein ACFFE8_03525 [Candidatus Heimdallarchaeota archaeon]
MEINTAVKPCWKCGQLTTIIETADRFVTEREIGEEIQTKYPFYYLDFSKESEQGYYMNHCEHCGEKQGDNLLFVERLLSSHEQGRPKPRVWDERPPKEQKILERNKLRRSTLDEFF